ncbi:MAG TPA: OmpA family protein, partial [Acetobacteraceae bacterium]|nr:OmpA family protein [Acetobacteraceae bacterium]
MGIRGALLATTILLALPVAARAQPIQGVYVGAAAGYDLPQNARVTPLTAGFGGAHLRLEKGGGVNGVGSIGYGFGNGLRLEVEGDFFRNSLDKLGRTPFPTSASGHVNRYGVMANALFDLDIGSPYVFPYLGVGVGYIWTHLDGSITQPGGPFLFDTDQTEGRFAVQGILGLSFPIPRMPGLSATLDYRFTDITAGAKFSGTQNTADGPITGRIKLGAQYDHSFLLGVRYAFYAPPPPAPAAPAAAPAPAPARSYLVFFDWDKATLTDRSRQIIREAADNSTHVQYTRLEVNGYTDTSGTAQYNMGLSLRRANAVAAELVRDGVSKQVIEIHGFGDTHLLVPTGQG